MRVAGHEDVNVGGGTAGNDREQLVEVAEDALDRRPQPQAHVGRDLFLDQGVA